MKILTLTLNFVLLGFVVLGILTGGLSKDDNYFLLKLALIIVPVMNIGLLFGSRVSIDAAKQKIDKASVYHRLRILALFMNVALLLIAILTIKSQYNSRGIISLLIVLTILAVPLMSLLTISLGRANKFEDLKRTSILTGISLMIIFIGTILGIRSYIGHSLRENIKIAQERYPGKAEDALIAYLADTTISPKDRSGVAVWTLGQIRSEKALPLLIELYKNDPVGKTCRGRHDAVLCQYGIHKAIVSIEHNWLGGFGSWAYLKKK